MNAAPGRPPGRNRAALAGGHAIPAAALLGPAAADCQGGLWLSAETPAHVHYLAHCRNRNWTQVSAVLYWAGGLPAGPAARPAARDRRRSW